MINFFKEILSWQFLITGASSGFGAAMATAFVQAGYLVIGTARRTEKIGRFTRQTRRSFSAHYHGYDQ